MTRVGLIVNPSAGRDIRRLSGGASVVDNYAKRRVAECALDGLTAVPDPPPVAVMPDAAGIAEHVVAEAPDEIDVTALEGPATSTAADTRRAASHFRDRASVVVVLGGDGTTRDAALELGDVPLVAVSTGTNNVVPSAVDGTVAGAAAGVIATGAVDPTAVTNRHGMVEARAETVDGEERVIGLAAVEVSSRSFVGTRAVLDPSEICGGVVSRAHPGDIGLASVAGALTSLAPGTAGGIALRLVDPADAARTARAIIAPGMTTTVGIADHRRLSPDEPARFDVPDGVVGADGERELELVETTVEIAPTGSGPRLVDIDATLERGRRAGVLTQDRD